MNTEKQIKFNIVAHDKIVHRYEKHHGEIFNNIEQNRIRDSFNHVIDAVKAGGSSLKALDVGCGSGNLTRHLIDLGVYTVSADVSAKFLELIEHKFSSTGLSDVLKLNGNDLANVEDGMFDISVAYSVLHHVPDYLGLVKEMCRVLKHGGVIYLDHEKNRTYFERTPEYAEFQRLAISKNIIIREYLNLLLSFSFYIRFVKKRIVPRYQAEGDIHVWPDDHIEWNEIEELLISEDFEIIQKKDYLVCKRSYDKKIYDLYKDKCTDTGMLIARKI